MGTADNFCLRWNDFESNISSSFTDIREEKEFFDVTLCCDEGNSQLQAHKIILAACSPFFRKILSRNPHQNPLIYLKGVDYANLAAVLNFMYHGEVNVAQDELNAFLRVAEELAVKGLTDNKKSNNHSNTEVPKKSIKRPPPLTPARAGGNSNTQQTSLKKKKTEMGTSSSSGYMSSNMENKMEVKPEIESSAENPLTVGNDEMAEGVFDESATAAEMDEEYGYEMIGDGGDYLVPDDGNADDSVAMGMVEESEGNKEMRTIDDFVMRNAQGTYWCRGCGHHSSSRRDLSRHIEAKHISGDYRCQFCNKSLTTKYNLQRHINKTHRKDAANTKAAIVTNDNNTGGPTVNWPLDMMPLPPQ